MNPCLKSCSDRKKKEKKKKTSLSSLVPFPPKVQCTSSTQVLHFPSQLSLHTWAHGDLVPAYLPNCTLLLSSSMNPILQPRKLLAAHHKHFDVSDFSAFVPGLPSALGAPFSLHIQWAMFILQELVQISTPHWRLPWPFHLLSRPISTHSSGFSQNLRPLGRPH